MLNIDPSRIGEALARPGMDTRTWSSLAIVKAVHVSAKGVYADIITITGIEETAALTTTYGGSGFGFYCPVAVGDWVVVEVPEGDWNAGARIVAQAWDPGTPPPQEAIDNPNDPALVVEPGRTFRVITGQGGNLVLDVGAAGTLRAGAETADQSALLGELFLAALGTLVTSIGSAVGGIPGGAAAGSAIAGALTTFQQLADLYKSSIVKLA